MGQLLMSEVRLTIERVDLTDIGGPTEVLLDLTETDETVLDRAMPGRPCAGIRASTRRSSAS